MQPSKPQEPWDVYRKSKPEDQYLFKTREKQISTFICSVKNVHESLLLWRISRKSLWKSGFYEFRSGVLDYFSGLIWRIINFSLAVLYDVNKCPRECRIAPRGLEFLLQNHNNDDFYVIKISE